VKVEGERKNTARKTPIFSEYLPIPFVFNAQILHLIYSNRSTDKKCAYGE